MMNIVRVILLGVLLAGVSSCASKAGYPKNLYKGLKNNYAYDCKDFEGSSQEFRDLLRKARRAARQKGARCDYIVSAKYFMWCQETGHINEEDGSIKLDCGYIYAD